VWSLKIDSFAYACPEDSSATTHIKKYLSRVSPQCRKIVVEEGHALQAWREIPEALLFIKQLRMKN